MFKKVFSCMKASFAPMWHWKHVNNAKGMGAMCVLSLVMLGCTTPVDVDLPDVPPQGVMEATVRNGEFPLVLLTTTQGYFDPVDLGSLPSLFVGGAEVVMTVGDEEVPLTELCTSDLDAATQALAADILDIPLETLASTDICVYLDFDSVVCDPGTPMTMRATWMDGEDNYDLSASTTMPAKPQLDSIWFEIPETSTNDSLGAIWTEFTDPEGFGDAYRWSSMRLGKDADFFYPLGSVFDDAFVDGRSFPFLSFRSPQPGVEEVPGEEGFWKTGDTVVVRLEGIGHDVFEVLRDFETSVANQGNPFALPTTPSTNVEGGLGWFVVYSGTTATTVCAP